MKAVLCPICNGTGQYNNVSPSDTCAERLQTCHGCRGRGWVEVRGDDTSGYYTYGTYFPNEESVSVT